MYVLLGRDQREPPDYINTGSGQPHSLERSNGRLVSKDTNNLEYINHRKHLSVHSRRPKNCRHKLCKTIKSALPFSYKKCNLSL